jgi:DivIVA domain-containing protein
MVDVIWLWALVTVGVIGAIAVVASGRWGSMVDVDEDRPDALISAGSLTGEQIKDVRFTHSVRGYRQDEVDTLLDLVAAELDRRDSMLRQANAGGDQTRAQTDGSARGTGPGDAAVPASAPDADDEAEHGGYPWTDVADQHGDVGRPADAAAYEAGDVGHPGHGRTAGPPSGR